jgi:DNA polymerase-3 subunit epsilon
MSPRTASLAVPASLRGEGEQISLDDLGIPLSEVTFVAVDLETTGGSPRQCAITEVGAVKFRGGEVLGEFQSLVNPGQPIPRAITWLTGIDDLTVRDAAPVEAVLPALLEFIGDAVFVAHNARFDFGFISEGLRRLDYPPLPGPPVCTAKLGRRVVGQDVRNCRLQTLAEYFRTLHRPTHRALADARACADVFHGLLDRAGRMGILTLEDLHTAGRARGQAHYSKIRLTDHLPRLPGVYLFRRAGGEILYVGKSKDIRSRVRSYFYGDSRKKIESMLAQTGSVEARPCPTELEALVTEARLIRRHEPRYNRRGKTWRRYAYLRVDPGEAWPRLKVVKAAKEGSVCLGPFASRRAAELAKEALEEAFPIRRCTRSMGRATRFSPCPLATMGRCLAPCDGRVSPERYEELVRALVTSLSCPDGLLEALEARMTRLASTARFEEAGLLRDRLSALVHALQRARFETWLASAETLVLADADGRRYRFHRGRLGGGEPVGVPVEPGSADEVAAVRSWMRSNRVRVVEAVGAPAEEIDGGRRLRDLARRIEQACSPG